MQEGKLHHVLLSRELLVGGERNVRMCDVAGSVSVCQCVTSLLAGPLQAKLSSCPAWCSSSAVWPGELAICTAEETENIDHIERFYLTVFNILIF